MCWRQFLIPGSDPGEMFANDTGVWRSVETTGDMRGSGEWLENMSVFAGPGWTRGTTDVNDISRQFSLLNTLP